MSLLRVYWQGNAPDEETEIGEYLADTEAIKHMGVLVDETIPIVVQKAQVKAAGIAVRASDTGCVLMLLREVDGEDKNQATWEFPGGHLAEGEEPLDAAKREWQEETGMTFPVGRVSGQWTKGKYHGFIFDVPKQFPLNALTTEALQWRKPEEIMQTDVRPELEGFDWTQLQKGAFVSSKGETAATNAVSRLRPLKRERAIVISPKGKVLWEKDGGHDFVPLKELEHADLEGATFIHNHPSGVAPSVDDIGSACALRLGCVMAVGKTGYTYYVYPPKDAPIGKTGVPVFTPQMWPAIARAGQAADESAREEYGKLLKAGKITTDEANIEHWNTVQEAIAEACGLDYQRKGEGHYDLPEIKAAHHSHIPVYNKRGVHPDYPPSKQLSAEADGTFTSLHHRQKQGTKPATEITNADADTRR